MARSRSPGAEVAGRGPHGPNAGPEGPGVVGQDMMRVIVGRLSGQLEAIAQRIAAASRGFYQELLELDGD